MESLHAHTLLTLWKASPFLEAPARTIDSRCFHGLLGQDWSVRHFKTCKATSISKQQAILKQIQHNKAFVLLLPE